MFFPYFQLPSLPPSFLSFIPLLLPSFLSFLYYLVVTSVMGSSLSCLYLYISSSKSLTSVLLGLGNSYMTMVELICWLCHSCAMGVFFVLLCFVFLITSRIGILVCRGLEAVAAAKALCCVCIEPQMPYSNCSFSTQATILIGPYIEKSFH